MHLLKLMAQNVTLAIIIRYSSCINRKHLFSTDVILVLVLA